MRNSEKFEATDYALVIRNHGERFPRGYRSDEHVDNSVLNSVVLAGVMQARRFYIVFRDHVFILEGLEEALDLGELRFYPDA